MTRRFLGRTLPVFVFCAAACEREPARPERPQAPPTRPLLAAPPTVPSQPESEGFIPHDAGPGAVPAPVAQCIARSRGALTPEVSGALGVLDAESFLEDACRLDLAVRARAPALCDAVRASVLRETCLARAAMIVGAPERCPEALGLRVRDPVCVALASRDVRLCAAATPAERARCLALARNSPRECERLDPLLRPGCLRDFAALGGALPALRGEPLPEGTATLRVSSGDAPTFALRGLARGAVLDETGMVWIVDPSLGWPRESAVAPEAPRVGVRIPTVGLDAGIELTVEARIALPESLALDTALGSARARARCGGVPRRRGDPVVCDVTVEGVRAGLALRCELHVETFVRDVVAGSSLR